MTDSATQSASPPVKIYHGSAHRSSVRTQAEILSGVARTADFLCESREHFSSRERKHPPKFKKNPLLVQPARYDNIPF
jgi:hypothetical protein